jgi:hypothetical protein
VTRQSRLIAILLAIAAIGVAGLMVVANQYRKTLAGSVAAGSAGVEDASTRAARLVDGFLAARAAAKAVVASYPDQIERMTAAVTGNVGAEAAETMKASADASSAYRLERGNALASHGMTYGDYVAVRRAWRAWTSGAPVDDAALQAALEARRESLKGAALGAVEVLDDAIR